MRSAVNIMNGSSESSSDSDNVGKDNVVVATIAVAATCSWYGCAIGIDNAWLAMSQIKFRRD